MPKSRPDRIPLIVWGLWLILVPLSGTLAQSPGLHPLEPPDTSSPRATLRSFIMTMQEASEAFNSLIATYRSQPGLYFSPAVQEQHARLRSLMKRAESCLNLSEMAPTVKEKVGLESRLMLKEIFDRIELPPLESVPDAGAMAMAGVDQWRIPHTEIVIARVKEGSQAEEFLFSNGTLKRLPEFYEKVKALPYKPGSWEGAYEFYTTIGQPRWVPWKLTDRLPPWAKAKVGDQALWRWIVFGLAFVGVLSILIILARWRRGRAEVHPIRENSRRLLMMGAVVVAAWFLNFLKDAINVTGGAHDIIATVLGGVFYLTAAWAIILIGNIVAEFIIASPKVKERSLDEAMARLTTRILSLTIAVVFTLYGAHALGLPVLPLLAGLGVGGLALALAAQPTIENFIAGLTLFADRPVRVGEFCRFGDTIGTVEEIGMRSTRIRTLDHTIVSVSNSDFAKARLENYSSRGKIWFHPRIKLRYETTPDQVRYILVEIRKLLYAHPKVHQDPARIRFVQFGECSLDLDVFTYIDTTDYGEFLEIAEDINLRIMDIVKAAGTELAIPAQIEYKIDKEPLDETQIRKTENCVQEWRTQRALYIPTFPPEKINELRDSLDYPPEGSASAQMDPSQGEA
jgi:MscS family membrane protein